MSSWLVALIGFGCFALGAASTFLKLSTWCRHVEARSFRAEIENERLKRGLR